MSERSTTDGPWCWQNKAARRKIRESFDRTNNVATALGVYDALTEIASDAGAERFTTTHAWIQQISGVSPSTIKGHLRVFEEIGLLKIETPPLRAPSTFTLRQIANGCPTIANGCPALANGKPNPLATSEEREERKEHLATADAAAGKPGSKSPKASKPRQRNPLLDALASVDGSDPSQVTGSGWSGVAKGLKEIREVSPDATADEIRRRAFNYRQHFRDATISPHALAKHWARCDKPPHGAAQTPAPAYRKVSAA